MTGQNVNFKKHAVLEFGSYVQTHEEHSNDMTRRTMGCICLGPTGNLQGGHWFMSLSSGERVVRYNWTELPMPREAIERVSQIGRSHGMPSTVTYANRKGEEISETLAEIDQLPDDSSDDDDDESYHPHSEDPSDDESLPEDTYDDEESHHDHESSSDGESADDEQKTEEWESTNDNDEAQIASDDATDHTLADVDEAQSEECDVPDDNQYDKHHDNRHDEHNEAESDGRASDVPLEDASASSHSDAVTEYERFQHAEAEGRARRQSKEETSRPVRQRKNAYHDPDFIYASIQTALEN